MCRRWQESASHLALVEVVDDLLVQLVLQLALRRRLVAVPLGQVSGTLLVRPLQREGQEGVWQQGKKEEDERVSGRHITARLTRSQTMM